MAVKCVTGEVVLSIFIEPSFLDAYNIRSVVVDVFFKLFTVCQEGFGVPLKGREVTGVNG